MNGVSVTCAVLCAAFVQASAFGAYRFDDPRNYYGVWSGPAEERVAYAKAMGYSHILYAKGMESVKGASELRFIIETPEYFAYPRSMDEDPDHFFEPECFTNGFLRADQIAYSCDLLSYDYGKDDWEKFLDFADARMKK